MKAVIRKGIRIDGDPFVPVGCKKRYSVLHAEEALGLLTLAWPNLFIAYLTPTVKTKLLFLGVLAFGNKTNDVLDMEIKHR